MKLKGDLKNKIEKAESVEEAKQIVGEVGVELSDEEICDVAGGINPKIKLNPKTTGIFIPGATEQL